MAEMNKIQSFKTFSQLKAEEKEIQLQEEAKGKREQLVTKIGETLAEMDITSFDELSEEQKKALVAKLFNEEIKEVEAEESKAEKSIEEGNAFIFAAAKAKQAGESEFEFKGKTYKVTLKADVGLKESYNLLINEGTRSQIGKIDKNGNITSVYVHWDGYPENMLPKVKKYDTKGVDKLIKLGKAGISSLEAEIGKKHDFNNPTKGWTIFYGRDRAEKNDMTSKGNVKNIKSYLKDVANSAGAEYVYLYDERDGNWHMADTYDDNELKLSESLITEATRWQFGIIDKAGNIESNYVHFDGYPSSVIPQIKGMDAKQVRSILKNSEMGGMSTLEKPYNDSQESTINKGTVKNIKKYLKEVESGAGAEYVYLFDEKSGKWVGADTYVDKALKPVDQIEESVVTEANYSLSKLEDMGFKAGEDYFEKVKGLLKNGPDLKAYKKGFTQGFVDNAAAYGVKESVVAEASKMDKEFKAMYAAIKEHDLLMKIAKDLFPKIAKEQKDGVFVNFKPLSQKQRDEVYVELVKRLKLQESVVTEAEVKSDKDFKEYAETVLKKAFGEDYDENKAGDVIDGLISKYSGDYGAMVGALQSSLD